MTWDDVTMERSDRKATCSNYINGGQIDKTAENYGDKANFEAAWQRVTCKIHT